MIDPSSSEEDSEEEHGHSSHHGGHHHGGHHHHGQVISIETHTYILSLQYLITYIILIFLISIIKCEQYWLHIFAYSNSVFTICFNLHICLSGEIQVRKCLCYCASVWMFSIISFRKYKCWFRNPTVRGEL